MADEKPIVDVQAQPLDLDAMEAAYGGTRGGYVVVQRPPDYTTSPELAQYMQMGQRRQAVATGATSIAAEGAQFAFGLATLREAGEYSRQRVAAIERKQQTGKWMTEAEEEGVRTALTAPIERQAEQARLRTEKVLASGALGKFTSRDYLETQKVGLEQVGAAHAGATVQMATTKERRAEKAKGEKEEHMHFLRKLKEERIWEPLSKFTGNLGEVIGKITAYAPAQDFSLDIQKMRKAGMSDADIAQTIKLMSRVGKKGREKILDGVIKNRTTGKGEEAEVAQPTPKTAEKAAPSMPDDLVGQATVNKEGFYSFNDDKEYDYKYNPGDDTWTVRKNGKPIKRGPIPHDDWMNLFEGPEHQKERTRFGLISAHESMSVNR